MPVPISKITVGTRVRKDLGDLAALASSVGEVGLLHPVVVTPSKRLIAGLRRIEACQLLGWDTVPVTGVDLERLGEAEWQENGCRKDLTPSEMGAVYLAAKARSPGRGRKRANLAHSPPGRTRERVAKLCGVSPMTQVVEAAQKNPRRYGHLVPQLDGMKALQAGSGVVSHAPF